MELVSFFTSFFFFFFFSFSNPLYLFTTSSLCTLFGALDVNIMLIGRQKRDHENDSSWTWQLGELFHPCLYSLPSGSVGSASRDFGMRKGPGPKSPGETEERRNLLPDTRMVEARSTSTLFISDVVPAPRPNTAPSKCGEASSRGFWARKSRGEQRVVTNRKCIGFPDLGPLANVKEWPEVSPESSSSDSYNLC